MKRISIALLALLATSSYGSAAPESISAEQQVQQANRDFFQAINTLNIERFDQLVTDDAVFPGVNNETSVTKKIVRDGLISQKANPHAHTNVKNVKITATKIYGNTAVVIGRFWAPRKNFKGHRAFTNVFMKTEGNNWKLILLDHHEVTKSP